MISAKPIRVNLILTELDGRPSPTALIDHALDACFVRSIQPPEVCDAIQVTPILHERLFVAMRPDHRLAERNALNLRDLTGEPMLMYVREHRTTFTEELIAMLRAAGVERSWRIR